jgi:hypothetical protein
MVHLNLKRLALVSNSRQMAMYRVKLLRPSICPIDVDEIYMPSVATILALSLLHNAYLNPM